MKYEAYNNIILLQEEKNDPPRILELVLDGLKKAGFNCRITGDGRRGVFRRRNLIELTFLGGPQQAQAAAQWIKDSYTS